MLQDTNLAMSFLSYKAVMPSQSDIVVSLIGDSMSFHTCPAQHQPMALQVHHSNHTRFEFLGYSTDSTAKHLLILAPMPSKPLFLN
jgi:hypothetical protein